MTSNNITKYCGSAQFNVAGTPDVQKAVKLLEAGDVVAIPTETVYGLAADARNDAAVAKIYDLKKRPSFNPLIVHVPDIVVAQHVSEFNALALKLARKFWPGPLTFVLPVRKNSGISDLALAGLKSVAVRIPAHPLTHSLLKRFNHPIVAPSANKSGTASPTLAEHVKKSLGDDVFVVDGGPCRIGVESTIIDLTTPQQPVLLRPGGLPREEIEAVIKTPLKDLTADAPIKSPGLLSKHYALDIPLRLNAKKAEAGEGFIGFGKTEDKAAALHTNLSAKGDLTEATANFFTFLHKAEAEAKAKGLTRLAIAPIPDEGLGLALNDRLQRATQE